MQRVNAIEPLDAIALGITPADAWATTADLTVASGANTTINAAPGSAAEAGERWLLRSIMSKGLGASSTEFELYDSQGLAVSLHTGAVAGVPEKYIGIGVLFGPYEPIKVRAIGAQMDARFTYHAIRVADLPFLTLLAPEGPGGYEIGSTVDVLFAQRGAIGPFLIELLYADAVEATIAAEQAMPAVGSPLIQWTAACAHADESAGNYKIRATCLQTGLSAVTKVPFLFTTP